MSNKNDNWIQNIKFEEENFPKSELETFFSDVRCYLIITVLSSTNSLNLSKYI